MRSLWRGWGQRVRARHLRGRGLARQFLPLLRRESYSLVQSGVLVYPDVRVVDQQSRRGKLRKKYLQNSYRSFLSPFFISVSRSFFEAHKLPYSFMLCLKCQDTDRELKLNEIAA